MTSDPVVNGASSLSVTRWLSALRDGDEFAAARLWEYANQRLKALANRQFGGRNPRTYDEDDVAASAFADFCRAIENGNYPDINSRGELWQMLVAITLNKARKKARDEGRLRRGGDAQHVPLCDAQEYFAQQRLDQDPELNAIAHEQCTHLLGRLDRDEVKMVALLKVEGYTNQEIAAQLGCTRRSVHRRLELIRRAWLGDSE